jgi:hypothetical protein
MDPAGVTLDDATVKLLTAASVQPIPLRNTAGEVVGYYISSAEMGKIEQRRRALNELWPPEEIARLEEARKNDPRPDVPHEEVLRWVEEQ